MNRLEGHVTASQRAAASAASFNLVVPWSRYRCTALGREILQGNQSCAEMVDGGRDGDGRSAKLGEDHAEAQIGQSFLDERNANDLTMSKLFCKAQSGIEGYAQTMADHLLGQRQTVGSQKWLSNLSCRLQFIIHQCLNRSRVLLKQKRKPGAFGERQLDLSSQGMAGRHHGVQGCGNVCEEFDAGMIVEVEGKAEISIAAGDPCRNLAWPHALDVKGDRGVSGMEGVDGIRQKTHQEAVERRDFHKAAFDAFEGVDLAPDPIEVGQGRARVAEQNFAGLGQAKAGRVAFEDGRAECIFDFQDLPADRRGGDVEFG